MKYNKYHAGGLVLDFSNWMSNAMKIVKYYTKTSMY